MAEVYLYKTWLETPCHGYRSTLHGSKMLSSATGYGFLFPFLFTLLDIAQSYSPVRRRTLRASTGRPRPSRRSPYYSRQQNTPYDWHSLRRLVAPLIRPKSCPSLSQNPRLGLKHSPSFQCFHGQLLAEGVIPDPENELEDDAISEKSDPAALTTLHHFYQKLACYKYRAQFIGGPQVA